YVVQVEEQEFLADSQKKKQDIVFAEIEQVQDAYAIPSAFTAYSQFLQLSTGKERFSLET
ncbi:MAG: hypothetical protein ACI4HI_14370, partial [Lachnospiraceae bacterium]